MIFDLIQVLFSAYINRREQYAFIVNANTLPRRDSVRSSNGEVLGSLVNLSQASGLKDLFIHHEILLPGHRSSPPHKHSQKEEFIYVLDGTPSVWIDGIVTRLSPGDSVGFPIEIPHMVINESEVPATLLVVSALHYQEDTCIFVEETLSQS